MTKVWVSFICSFQWLTYSTILIELTQYLFGTKECYLNKIINVYETPFPPSLPPTLPSCICLSFCVLFLLFLLSRWILRVWLVGWFFCHLPQTGPVFEVLVTSGLVTQLCDTGSYARFLVPLPVQVKEDLRLGYWPFLCGDWLVAVAGAVRWQLGP